MKVKTDRKKKKIYFSDAMNQIDESIDYNEYSEINSSDYFRETLYKAEDEVDKMMSSPLMGNYKKYKKQKITMSLLKKNKDFIFRKLKWLQDKTKLQSIDANKKKSKINLNSMLNRLKQINTNNKNQEEKEQIQKQTFQNEISSFLPKINTLKTFNIDKSSQIEDSEAPEIVLDKKKKDEKKKHVLLTISNSVSKKLSLNDKLSKNRNINYSTNNAKPFYYTQNRNKIHDNKKKVESLENMYLNCIKGLKTLESYENEEQPKLLNINSYKINGSRDLENKIYKKDNMMKKFLEENISELNKDKNNRKQEQILKDYAQLKLKKDPIIKLSEKFAYFNRKPLLTLFNCEDKEENKRNGPLAKLKLKDKKIMRKLENDNREKNLLMKRLDEDQVKYIKGGYFIMSKDKENDNDKKKILKKMKLNSKYNTGYNNEFFNQVKRIVPYENE